MVIEIKTKNPKAGNLMTLLNSIAGFCEENKEDCSKCPGHEKRINSAGIRSYRCRLGMFASGEARHFKETLGILDEGDLSNLSVAAINYTGIEAKNTYEVVADKLLPYVLT